MDENTSHFDKKRKTVGKLSLDLAQKDPDTRDPIELQREIQKGYSDNIIECLDNSKKIYSGDFFIVVETKKEKLMPNVIRNFIFGRSTCPTPSYDQTVYRYHRVDDRVEFLWVVPSKSACNHLRFHALEVVSEEQALLKFVLDFYDDTLLRYAKKLNGEVKDSNILATV